MTMQEYDKGAHIEIVEPLGEEEAATIPCIKPRLVRINGVNVGLILRDSLRVDASGEDGDPVMVTLTLLPRSVTIKAE